MKIETISILLLVNFQATLTNGGVCSKDQMAGKAKAWLLSDKVDSKSGQLFMMRHEDYFIPCCGVISEWHVNIKNPGTIRFQVWRGLGTGEYVLIGENMATYNKGEEENYFKVLVDAEDFIPVREGDFIGWYNAGNPMVSYSKEKNGIGALITSVKQPVEVDETVDWSGVEASEPRNYAVDFVVSKGIQPKFGNLNDEISVTNNLEPGAEIYKLTFVDIDDVIIPKAFTVRLETFSKYFKFNESTNSVQIVETPPTDKYSLDFTVKDQCGSKNSGTLKVIVQTKMPAIMNLPSAVIIREDRKYSEMLLKELEVIHTGPVVCNLKNVDPNQGKRYFLIRNSNDSKVFGVYLKATANLHYEDTDAYEITITCSTGKQSDTKSLFVNVVPNATPLFTNLPSTVLVHADESIVGGIIFQVTSEDEENNVVFYNMSCEPDPCPFNITKGGSVVAVEDLRSSQYGIYFLHISIGDNYNTAGPEMLVVNITGLNRPPIIYNIAGKLTISINENSPPGTSIYEVKVADQDKDDNITFSLSAKPPEMLPFFAINETSGLITTLAPIDYEGGHKKPNVKFTVTASDGKARDSKGFRLTVIDVNEAPEFSSPVYTVLTPEGKPGSDTKAKIKAKDVDKGDEVHYSLECGEESNQFQINEKTAEITQTYGLDVDLLGKPENEISCNITAIDSKGANTSAEVIFIVSDEDDNAPDFERTSYIFVVTKDFPVFSAIGTTYAVDIDTTSANNKLYYHIDEETNDFVIDDNGTIYVMKDMSKVSVGTVFRMTVIAEDGGRKSDKVPVTVVVLGGNYSMLVSSILAQKLTFFDVPENVGWLVTAAYLLLVAIVLSIYVCTLSLHCTVNFKRGHLLRNLSTRVEAELTDPSTQPGTIRYPSRKRVAPVNMSKEQANTMQNSSFALQPARDKRMKIEPYAEQANGKEILSVQDLDTLDLVSYGDNILFDTQSDGHSRLSITDINPAIKDRSVITSTPWKPWGISDFKETTSPLRGFQRERDSILGTVFENGVKTNLTSVGKKSTISPASTCYRSRGKDTGLNRSDRGEHKQTTSSENSDEPNKSIEIETFSSLSGSTGNYLANNESNTCTYPADRRPSKVFSIQNLNF